MMTQEHEPAMRLAPKYPSTPYWPWSPTVGRGDAVHPNPERFVGSTVVVTEKLDGGTTSARASAWTMCKRMSTGPGTGGRVESRGTESCCFVPPQRPAPGKALTPHRENR